MGMFMIKRPNTNMIPGILVIMVALNPNDILKSIKMRAAHIAKRERKKQ